MTKHDVLERIQDLGLLAVIRGPSQDLTLRMVEALVQGGVEGIEITFSTPNALEVVRSLRENFGDSILLGMGTLTVVEQVDAAMEAGAEFLVSPHTEPGLAKAMCSAGCAVMMGAMTPSEVMQSYRLGSDIVKVFPGSLGGPAFFKALKGPFPEIPLMPTGGVSLETIPAWFAAGAEAVGAGSNLCSAKLAQAGKFDEIRDRAEAFARRVREAKNGKNRE